MPKLIRKRAVGFDSIAIQLLDQMICLEDRFKIPDFQVVFLLIFFIFRLNKYIFKELRIESTMLILAYHPELISHAIRVLFSNQCSMNNRYFILNAMDKAALFLYEGCPNNEVIYLYQIN